MVMWFVVVWLGIVKVSVCVDVLFWVVSVWFVIVILVMLV